MNIDHVRLGSIANFAWLLGIQECGEKVSGVSAWASGRGTPSQSVRLGTSPLNVRSADDYQTVRIDRGAWHRWLRRWPGRPDSPDAVGTAFHCLRCEHTCGRGLPATVDRGS